MKFPVFAPDGADAGAGAGAAAADKGGAAAGADGKGGPAAGTGDGKGAGGAASGAGASGTGTGAGAADDKGAGAGGAAAGAGAGAEKGAAAQPSWDADHWKSTFAGEDAKKKAWAERRPDLKTALEAGFQADQKISELTAIAKTVLPKDATPEQLAQYRKDNGIPEKPEDYLAGLPKEVALSDEDKGVLTPYLGLMQKHNMPPALAKEFIELRQAEVDRWTEERVAHDAEFKRKTEDVLRQDWGTNYRAEINNINNMLSGAPQEVQDMFYAARNPDGTGLLATPEALRWFAQLARTINPYSAPVGGDGGALDQKGVDARINEIESWMGSVKGSENYKKYYGNDKVQSEYRALIDAREMLKKRTAA